MAAEFVAGSTRRLCILCSDSLYFFCGNGEDCAVLSVSLTREEFKQNLLSRGFKTTHQNIRGLENNFPEVQEL